MTKPELDPELAEMLRLAAESKGAIPIAPIDDDASTFVVALAERAQSGEVSSEVAKQTANFVSRFVGWSSKDIDAETGNVPIASLNPFDKIDAELDQLGYGFLSTNQNVKATHVVSDQFVVDQFDFHQARKNGSVRAVTIYRKQPLDPIEGVTVDYFLTYADVGQYHPAQETILELARMHIEELGKNSRALATHVVELPVNRLKSVGSAIMHFGRSE